MQIAQIEADAKKSHQEFLAMTNNIEEAVTKNNHIFAKKWEQTHEWINHWADKHQLLKTHVIKLKSLSGLQQTALQSCQNQIAGLEETIEQLVTAVKKLEKSVCWCHDWLLLPGPHYIEGEEEEVVVDSEEADDKDGLEYETNIPSTASYTTLPSTRGHSETSPCVQTSPSPERSDPEDNMALCMVKLKACIEAFLEEVEEDMELDNLPPLENITPVPIPNPIIPSFVPFTMSTSQCCVPPKMLNRGSAYSLYDVNRIPLISNPMPAALLSNLKIQIPLS